MEEADEIPIGLRTLARELDALAGNETALIDDVLPDLSGADFQPVKLLGRGGMGVVYAAIQLSLDRQVAVKLLPATIAEDDEAKQRLLAEARTLARLHHPNIIQTIAAGEANGRIYFAMELAQGQTANHHHFDTIDALIRFGISMAEALAYVHACGVIHRDVKPGNVFVAADGKARLGDFGLACLREHTANEKVGTDKYMAPEIRANGNASAKSDQYAFGVMMIELAAKMNTTPNDDDFRAILSKASADQPQMRYETMEDVADDLSRCLHLQPVHARRSSVFHILALGARRSPIAAVGISFAGLCLVALTGSLAVGYVRTTRALAATEEEAAKAATSLVTTITTIDRTKKDVRANEIERAINAVSSLAQRFPDNQEIKQAIERLEYAKRAHERLKARRAGNLRPPANPPPRTNEKLRMRNE